MARLLDQFGGIDIYLFDQLQRERIVPGMRVLDAGCGDGRNLVYFFRERYDVYATDSNGQSIDRVRLRARSLGCELPESNFRVEPVEAMSFPDGFFHAVIASAVFHFARDDSHFHAMVRETWRVLAPGGVFFARLASSIGIEEMVKPVDGRRCLLPDGSERYLVDEAMLCRLTGESGGRLLDPLKTTIVQGQRAMTTWVAAKAG